MKAPPPSITRTSVPKGRAAIICAVTILSLTAQVHAQTPRQPSAWAAAMVLEPLVLAHGGLSARCNPMAAARAGWGIERIERLLQLADHQRRLLVDLKAELVKAADLSGGTCPATIPTNSADRIVFMQQRLASLHRAIDAIVPPFDAFYRSLSTEQRGQLDAGPRRWRWR
jgi:hypothetical protein